jgi:hypothetical protein
MYNRLRNRHCVSAGAPSQPARIKYMNYRLFNLSLLLSALYIVFSIIYFILGYPYRGVILLAGLIPSGILVHRISTTRNFVDNRIGKVVGITSEFSVYTKTLPGYRFVDVFNAAEHYAESLAAERLESQHAEALAQIMNGDFFSEPHRHVKPAEYRSRSIDVGQEGFFPSDVFWLARPGSSTSVGVVRVRTLDYSNEVSIEIAAKNAADAESAIAAILQRSARHSIYKNRTIEISFQQEVRDEYGSVEMRERVDPIFLSLPPVTESDIILDDETYEILRRTVIDFHRRRETLVGLGLPARRGVLFYGPPGTGKTYTSRFLSNELGTATTIITSGMSLLHVRSVCNIGRMLQPSVIVLEDVDLVYSQRETNAYSTALGELMDVLDGFQADDEIIFILTTNSIERVEAAIRERPGRISQCVYFGAPTADLRKRYLRSLLAPFDQSSLDLDQIVKNTEGATQAFLKELVFRSIQFASEHSEATSPGQLGLSNLDFDNALTEMRKSAGHAGEAIIGFHTKR